MESAVAKIYNDMRLRIMKSEFDVNTCFIENGIAEEYGVSRGTAREAMLLLCEEKFLVKHPRKGYFLYRFTEKEWEDMSYARFHLELSGIRLVIANCPDEEIRSLYDILGEVRTNYLPEQMDNYRFHTSLAALSGNQTLVALIAELLGCTQRRYAGKKDPMGNLNLSHRHIIDAILARDPEMASRLLAIDIGLPEKDLLL